LTAFIFTDKAEKILSNTQSNMFVESILVIGVFAFLFYKTFLMIRKKEKNKGFAIAAIIFFIIFFASSAKDEFQQRQYLENEYSKLLAVYQNQEYKITEGAVSVLHSEPEGGHAAGDIIRVGNVEFELSCFHNTFGYNKTIIYGGILTEGAFAKIYYYQTDDLSSLSRIILRIDLLEEPSVPFKKIDPLLPCAG
jgi:hypothetical protein